MNLLDKYNDYMLDKILESVKNDETYLIISPLLKSYLMSINHDIAKAIVYDERNSLKNEFKVTLLDIVEKYDNNGVLIPDIISFMQSNKTIAEIGKNNNFEIPRGEELEYKYREEIKDQLFYNTTKYFNLTNKSESTIGRLVNKLYPNVYKPSGEPGKDIESFVNMYKSIRSNVGEFELVDGEHIRHWYNEENYGYPIDNGTIYSSCMRYSECYEYLKFYSGNNDKVSLLILKDPEDDSKIIGRAIVWKIDLLDDEEVSDKYFMDRIYYTFDYIVDSFKKYAVQHNWLYKDKQNMNEDEYFIDETNNTKHRTIVIENVVDFGNGHYPYMDTLKYLERDGGRISNDSNEIDSYITLTDTEGSAEGVGTWSDFYDDYVDEDNMNYCEYGDCYRYDNDCFYSDTYNEYVDNDYADENGCYCDYSDNHDRWRMDGDYEETSNGDTATKEYAQDNWYWSDYSNEWCIDAQYSDYHETYINDDDSVEVYTDANQSGTDYRADDDNTWFEWEHDNEKYSDDVTIEELREYNGLEEEEEEDEEDDDNTKKKKKKKQQNKK